MLRKILFLTNIPAPYTIAFFNDLGNKINLTVLFERKNATDRDKSWGKFGNVSFDYKFLKGKRIRQDSIISLDVIKYIKKRKYDLIIVGNYASPTGILAILYMKIRHIRYAIHADGGLISDDSDLKYKIKRFLINGADVCFSSGSLTSKYFRYYGARKGTVAEYPFTSIRSSQISEYFSHDRNKNYLGFEEKNLIVSVGQIIPRKGFDILIKSMSMIRNEAYLIIIGGEATEDLKNLITELKLSNIKFIPFLPFDNVLEYISAADIFVLTTREDIWGLVINEALAMGTPIVSTDRCVAAVDLVEEGVNGFIVHSEDEKAAADRLDLLLSNENLRNTIRNNNLKKAEKYTIENMAIRYCEIIDQYLI